MLPQYTPFETGSSMLQTESAMDSLTDTVSVDFLRELMDWAEVDPLISRLATVDQV